MPPAGFPGMGARGPIVIGQSAPSIFPLAVHASGRYLVDAQGVPWPENCDAGWFSCCNFSDTETVRYFDEILTPNGFNSFILMLIVHATDPDHWYPLNQPADYYGNQPFLTPGWLDTPNPAYFARPKAMIDAAFSRGIGVELFHTYVGAAGSADGWRAALEDSHNTNTVCFNWGVFLATTFTQPNIIWMHGGDDFLSGTALARFQQIVAGIQSVSRNRLAGSEWSGPDSLLTDQAGFVYGTDPATSDMQINTFYGAGAGTNNLTQVTARAAWSIVPPMPAKLQEPVYVDAWYAAPNRNYDVRNAYFRARTSGAIAGATLGERRRWDGYPDALSTALSQGTVERKHAHALFASLPWYRLIPSGTASGFAGRDLVVSGAGSGDTEITSCITDNGSHMLVFVPRTDPSATRTFSVDLRGMAAASRADWWNPTTGVETPITGGNYTLSNTLASQSFTTPGSNGSTDSVGGVGSNDWVLRIRIP